MKLPVATLVKRLIQFTRFVDAWMRLRESSWEGRKKFAVPLGFNNTGFTNKLPAARATGVTALASGRAKTTFDGVNVLANRTIRSIRASQVSVSVGRGGACDRGNSPVPTVRTKR